MKITTRQAAEILGVSNVTIRTLIKQGKLTNLATDTSDRKHKLLDAKQVKELKAELKPLSRRNIILKDNGVPVHPPVLFPEASYRPANSEQEEGRFNRIPSPVSSISDRLASIEKKLEYLISMWS